MAAAVVQAGAEELHGHLRLPSCWVDALHTQGSLVPAASGAYHGDEPISAAQKAG